MSRKPRAARRSHPRVQTTEPTAGRALSCPTPVLVGTLALVCLLLYGRTVGFGYVQADDTDLVLRNQPFLIDLANAPETFRQSYFAVEGDPDPKAYYRPLAILSFMLDAQVAGAEPGWYHATNVVLHVVAVLLVFHLLTVFGTDRMLAWVLALIFAVHPANVQAVGWLVGRNDSLMTVFGVASIIGLLAYARNGRRGIAVVHLAGFALALFTKETGLLLLAVFVGCLWRVTDPVAWYRKHWLLVIGYVAIGGTWFVLRARALAGGESTGVALGDYPTIVVAKMPELVLYAGKALLPFRMNTMPGVDAAGLVLGALSIGVLGWVMIRWLEPGTSIFSAGWFFLFLAPILVIVGLPAYEHRMYFPLVGLLVGLSRIRRPSMSPAAQRRTVVGGILVAAVYFTLAYRHVGVFENPYTYWTNATTGTPFAPLAHVNVGQLYESSGDIDRAQLHYSEAIALDPRTPNANNNMGVIMTRRNDLERARAYFEAELASYPSNPDGLLNLGLYYELTGQPDRAVAMWERAIETNPGFTPAYSALAEHYEALNDVEKAALYRRGK